MCLYQKVSFSYFQNEKKSTLLKQQISHVVSSECTFQTKLNLLKFIGDYFKRETYFLLTWKREENEDKLVRLWHTNILLHSNFTINLSGFFLPDFTVFVHSFSLPLVSGPQLKFSLYIKSLQVLCRHRGKIVLISFSQTLILNYHLILPFDQTKSLVNVTMEYSRHPKLLNLQHFLL